MSRISKLIIKESEEELKDYLRKQTRLSLEKRVRALLGIKQNRFRTRGLLAASLGVHLRTMERWLTLYEEEGIDRLLSLQPRRKGSILITAEIHQGLEERLKDSHDPFLGYWDAHRWVEEQYGVRIGYHGLRAYLIREFKTKLKSGRKSHVKKDPEAEDAFFKTSLHSG